MLEANEAKVLAMIGQSDVVLDIGGWARPFNRANYVLDFLPFESRGRHYSENFGLHAQGGAVEHFTAETWIVRDICDHEPWPFADKSIDYCVCSHTLEDIRDPLWVCREIIRVAKRGYIEIPSRIFEMTRGREEGVPVGLSHHRWIVEVEGSHISFSQKYHFVHGDPRLSLPSEYVARLPEDQLSTWLFWDGQFTYSEGRLGIEDHLAFAEKHVPGRASQDAQADPDHLRFQLEMTQKQLTAAYDAMAQVEAVREAREEAAALKLRLDQYQDLGPMALKVARGLQGLSRRYPKLAAPVKRVVGGSSR